MVLHVRGVNFVLEQPVGSALLSYPTIVHVLAMVSAMKVVTYLRRFGHECVKPTWLWSNHAAALSLARPRPPVGKDTKAKNKKAWKKSATGWFQGTKDLKATQEYPKAFCEAIVRIAKHGIRANQAAREFEQLCGPTAIELD